jgi:ABC-2 type transport system ATP-binding protein
MIVEKIRYMLQFFWEVNNCLYGEERSSMIEAQDLTRRFGDFTAVKQISLSVPAGSVIALLGQNGAGKTTTVRMLSALLAPSEGDAFVGGYDVRKNPTAVRSCVGLVTDTPGLFEQMTVPAYLDFFANIYGMPAKARTRRVNELLEFFELNTHRREKMVGFSKGMKQKVALARALIHEPRVLFLDEPTSGLDPVATRSVRELIHELKQSDRAIILCTHDLDEAERLADTVAIMRKGEIIALDTSAGLRSQFSEETVVRIAFAQACPLSLDALRTIDGLNTPQFSSATRMLMNENTSENTLLTYRTTHLAQINPQLITRLSAAGALIISVTCETATLEDVYMRAMDESDKKQSSNDINRHISSSKEPIK